MCFAQTTLQLSFIRLYNVWIEPDENNGKSYGINKSSISDRLPVELSLSLKIDLNNKKIDLLLFIHYSELKRRKKNGRWGLEGNRMYVRDELR